MQVDLYNGRKTGGFSCCSLFCHLFWERAFEDEWHMYVLCHPASSA